MRSLYKRVYVRLYLMECVCVFVYIYMCVCVCVWAMRSGVCVCVLKRERERERAEGKKVCVFQCVQERVSMCVFFLKCIFMLPS